MILVEDDESDVLFLKRGFQKSGISLPLYTVGNGKDAIDYLAGTPPFDDRTLHPAPTHMILDLKLPEKSGLEVLQWVRKSAEWATLPVTVLTSSSERSDIRRARELAANCYIVKPMSFADLLGIARQIGDWVATGTVPADNLLTSDQDSLARPSAGD